MGIERGRRAPHRGYRGARRVGLLHVVHLLLLLVFVLVFGAPVLPLPLPLLLLGLSIAVLAGLVDGLPDEIEQGLQRLLAACVGLSRLLQVCGGCAGVGRGGVALGRRSRREGTYGGEFGASAVRERGGGRRARPVHVAWADIGR